MRERYRMGKNGGNGMENWKKTIIQGAICVGLLCVIWGGYFLIKTYHTDRILDIKEDDFSWVYQVDSVKTDGKDFVLQGFAFELKKNSEKGAFEIVLENVETGKRYFPKMEYIDRKDVNEYFLCDYDYLQSGFRATINVGKLNLEDAHYKILIRDGGERKTYQTGIYVSRGMLMYTNPLEFVPLDVKGTDLEQVVEDGVLRVYCPEYGMYVYQYEGELYWIAESEYDFNENGETYVQWHLETSQIDKLPQERLDGQWHFDNLGFYFSENEINTDNLENYRLAKKELPTEYSITRMNTGRHEDGWIWKVDFRPYYDLQ